MDCKKHKKMIDGYKGSIEDLAKEIGDLHYEELAKLLHALSLKIGIDAYYDNKGGRVKLSDALLGTSVEIKKAAKLIDKAWEISKPFMKG